MAYNPISTHADDGRQLMENNPADYAILYNRWLAANPDFKFPHPPSTTDANQGFSITGDPTKDMASYISIMPWDNPESDPAITQQIGGMEKQYQAANNLGNPLGNPTAKTLPGAMGGPNPFMGNALPRYSFGGFGFYPGGDNRANMGLLGGGGSPQGGGGGLLGGPGGGGNIAVDGKQFIQSVPTGGSVGPGQGLLTNFGASPSAQGGFGAPPLPAGQRPPAPPGSIGGPYTGSTFTGNQGATLPSFMTGPDSYYGGARALDPTATEAGLSAWQQQTMPDRMAYFQSLSSDPRAQFMFLGANNDINRQFQNSMNPTAYNQWVGALGAPPSGSK